MYSAKYRGVVKGLHEDYEDKSLVRLEIERTDHPKPKTKKGVPEPYMPTQSQTISKEMAQHFAIGDRVECETTVRKIRAVTRKAGNPGNPGKEKAYA
jgi:hypothetical protein